MELMERRRILLNTPHIDIVTGFQFVTDMVAPIESLVINFSPIQDLHGYDSPWPAGGGKNLFDKTANDTDKGYVSGKYIKLDGTLITPGSGIEWNTSEYISVLPNTQYTLSGLSTVSSTAPSIGEYNSNKEFITATSYNNRTSITITTNASTNWVRISIQQDRINGIQLEQGATATSYAPYSNICPISGWTGLDVTRTGKNLANMFNDGKIPSVSNGQLVTANGLRSDYIPMDGDTQITFSGNTSSTLYCFFYDSGKNFISWKANASPMLATTPSNTAYIMLRADASATSLQLEFGSTATTYEPYQGTTYPISWQTEAGTVYGGTLDVTTGVLTVDRAKIDLSTLTWTTTSTVYMSSTTLTDAVKPSSGGVVANAISGRYPLQSSNAVSSGSVNGIGMRPNGGLYVSASYGESPTGLFVYYLETPVTYQLTPQQVLAFKGTNNLSLSSQIKFWTHRELTEQPALLSMSSPLSFGLSLEPTEENEEMESA